MMCPKPIAVLLLSLSAFVLQAQEAPRKEYEERVKRYYKSLEEGQVDSALMHLDTAMKLWPEAPTNYLLNGLRAEIFLTRKDTLSAIKALCVAIDSQPNETTLRQKRGELLTLQRRYTEALADYDQILRIEPTKETALYNRALVRMALGLMEGASSDLENIIRHNEKAYLPRIMLAEIALKKKEEEQAERIYNYLISTYPNIPEAYRRRASLYLKQKRNALAIEDINKIFEIGRGIQYHDYILRGKIRLRYNDKAGAANDFRLAESMGATREEIER